MQRTRRKSSVFYLSNLESKLLLTPKEGNEAAKIVNDLSDVALLLHTFGTTSWPKGVPLTQFNLVSSVTNIKSVYKLTESDSTMILLHLFHVHGLIGGLLSSVRAGGSVTLLAAGRCPRRGGLGSVRVSPAGALAASGARPSRDLAPPRAGQAVVWRHPLRAGGVRGGQAGGVCAWARWHACVDHVAQGAGVRS
nr:oxalate--CoA ligase-like [Ipomoea trifida]